MQEGYTECVVLLVKRYPELLKYMLSLVMEEDMLEEKVRKKERFSQSNTRSLCTFTSGHHC